MDPMHKQLSSKMENGVTILQENVSKNVSDDNANLETSTTCINRNLFSEMPVENGCSMTNDLEFLVSSSEENTETFTKASLACPPLSPSRNCDVLFDFADENGKEIFSVLHQPNESLGLVLGMNEIIDASEGEIRKVYVKKISTDGAVIQAMNETNTVGLGDEILAINGTHIKNLSRTECLNLLIDLPNKITFLLKRNTVPWTTGPRCSFYLNLVDMNPESILSPAPKLFTNEGKKIPDKYKLLEVSLYRETSDLLGISIVPSYGATRYYYQIKELEPTGICAKSKLLNKGDCLVSCNGNSLYKIPLNQCLNILKSEGPSLTFEVFRKDDNQTVSQSSETQPVYDDTSEVRNNNNNDDNDDNDGQSPNIFTSELLIPTEIKPRESVQLHLEANNKEHLSDQTVLNNLKLSTSLSDSFEVSHLRSNSPKSPLYLGDSPEISDLSNSDPKLYPFLSDSPEISDLSNSDPQPSPSLSDSSEISKSSYSAKESSQILSDSTNLLELSKSDSKLSLDSESPDSVKFSSSDPNISAGICDSVELSSLSIDVSKLSPDFNNSHQFFSLNNDSPDISDPSDLTKVSIKDSKVISDFSDFPDILDLSNTDSKPFPDISDSAINNFESKPSPDHSGSQDLLYFSSGDPGPITDINYSTNITNLNSYPKTLAYFGDSADSLKLGNSDLPNFSELSNSNFKPFPDTSDSPNLSYFDSGDSKTTKDFSDSSHISDLSNGDIKRLPDNNVTIELSKSSVSDSKPSLDNNIPGIVNLNNVELNTSHIISDSKLSPDIGDIFDWSETNPENNNSPDLLELNNIDFNTSPTISNPVDLSKLSVSDLNLFPGPGDSADLLELGNSDPEQFQINTESLADSKLSPGTSHSPEYSKSHSSSFECEVKNTLSKPLLDLLTGSPFKDVSNSGSLDNPQKPIDACSAEPSPPPVVNETCMKLTTVAVESSPQTNWSNQLSMTEHSPSSNAFNLDGLEEFSNNFINDANELNNNFSTGYPCSSNEDLISIGTDVLSPGISNPTFANHAAPWEAAGEAKSETLPPEVLMSHSVNQKNSLNEFIDTVDSPDHGLDPLDGLQENIIQVPQHDKGLLQPTNFHPDVSKTHNLAPSNNASLDSDLAEEERASPISCDDSLSGSIGIHTADEEGDIPLSSRNSDNDLIEEMSALSPDSGRADSPRLDKNSSYTQEKFGQKELLTKLESRNTSDDTGKLTDEEHTIYHTVSDISKKNVRSEKHGSFDSSDSCGTSVGSFESCAETGEQDHFSIMNSKTFTSRNEEAPQKSAQSLPRNAFSSFKEFQTNMIKSPNEKTSKPDGRLFSFNEITASSLKSGSSYGKKDYLNTFSTNLFSRNYRLERKSHQVRSEDKPFQVEVLKGIIGLGMMLKVDDQGFVKVTDIQNNSPIGRNGIIKIGDYILSINNTNVVQESDSRVQQILRLLPRGLIKVVASAVPISDWKKYTEDDPSNISTGLNSANFPEVSSVTSLANQQEKNHKVLEETSPLAFAKMTDQYTSNVDKIEKPSLPVSLQKSSIYSSENESQTEQGTPLSIKSSLSFSSTETILPQERPKLQSVPARTTSLLTDEFSDDSRSHFETISNVLEADNEDVVQDLVPSPADNLIEITSETSPPLLSPRPASPRNDAVDELSTLKVISVESPMSPVTKLPDLQEETLVSSLSDKTQSSYSSSSSPSVLLEYETKSPVLSFTENVISSSEIMTENKAPSTELHEVFSSETVNSDSVQTSFPSSPPRRIGSTNRKLPDIFQSSHTLRSVSSPVKSKTFSEISSPSENVPTEKSALEHKSQKIVDVSNIEIPLSQSITMEPKTVSDLTDPNLKTHSIEITENVPKVEVAVSQIINIEPSRASTLSEGKTEKSSMKVLDEVAKPEAAVIEFAFKNPLTDVSEQKIKTQSAAVVEPIAKPKVAVSQFIGVRPKIASDLSSAKEMTNNKIESSKTQATTMATLPSGKEKGQNIEVLSEVSSPKSEVAISKSIRMQPSTTSELIEISKSSRVSDVHKESEKPVPLARDKSVSTSRPDIVPSAEHTRPSLLRYKSIDVMMRHAEPVLRKSGSVDNPSGKKTRPKTEIFSKEMTGVFSKRKWCISIKSGQTNFADPSDPESIDKVVGLKLIDEDDLGRLLTSANFALDKMSFSNNEEIHIAILEKEATEKIGIRLKKGERQELVISLLEADGAAIKHKFIQPGDSLLLVNGKPAWNQTVMDLKVWLQTIETRIILVLCRHPMDEEEAANDCEYLDVVLQKSRTGIGFCLEGGVGCPLGDRPISVKRIFKGGPAEKSGQLKVGDEILKVNGMDFQKQRHFVAWNHLKFLPEGEVKLHICRRKSHAAPVKSADTQAVDSNSETDISG